MASAREKQSPDVQVGPGSSSSAVTGRIDPEAPVTVKGTGAWIVKFAAWDEAATKAAARPRQGSEMGFMAASCRR